MRIHRALVLVPIALYSAEKPHENSTLSDSAHTAKHDKHHLTHTPPARIIIDSPRTRLFKLKQIIDDTHTFENKSNDDIKKIVSTYRLDSDFLSEYPFKLTLSKLHDTTQIPPVPTNADQITQNLDTVIHSFTDFHKQCNTLLNILTPTDDNRSAVALILSPHDQSSKEKKTQDQTEPTDKELLSYSIIKKSLDCLQTLQKATMHQDKTLASIVAHYNRYAYYPAIMINIAIEKGLVHSEHKFSSKLQAKIEKELRPLITPRQDIITHLQQATPDQLFAIHDTHQLISYEKDHETLGLISTMYWSLPLYFAFTNKQLDNIHTAFECINAISPFIRHLNNIIVPISIEVPDDSLLGLTKTKVVEQTYRLLPYQIFNFYSTLASAIAEGKHSDSRKISKLPPADE